MRCALFYASRCIASRHFIRLAIYGGFYAWEDEETGHKFKGNVTGQVAVNDSYSARQAALDRFTISYLPQEFILKPVKTGRLVRMPEDFSLKWRDIFSTPLPAVILAAFRAFVAALRQQGKK